MIEMREKIALVTGSSRGLGKHIALCLAEAASGVAVHYFQRKKEAGKVVASIETKGIRSTAFRADLLQEKEARNLVHRVIEEFGRIDILVNSFGPILVRPWNDVTAKEWEDIFRSNLLSSFFCIQEALQDMRSRKWGRIINIGYSRVEQLSSFQTITPYAVAKTGLLILTRSVAASEAGWGITVNMVSPGLMEEGILPADAKVPAGRLGKPEDVATAVLFLSSENASYITGTNLSVAGGWKL
jgi:3-oxoacyl-[acyl-carrier protein] reductase